MPKAFAIASMSLVSREVSVVPSSLLILDLEMQLLQL